MPSAHAVDNDVAPAIAGGVPSPRPSHRSHRRERSRPRLLTLVDNQGHYCQTWQQRDGDGGCGVGDYTCACVGGHVVPAEDVSAAKVRAAHHLASTDDDVITWSRPARYERLTDPREPDYTSDTFLYYREKGVWASADGVQIPDYLYEEAKRLAARHVDRAVEVP